jgi:hypothetical protein
MLKVIPVHQKNELYETGVANFMLESEAQLEDVTEKPARLRAMGAGAASR